MRLDRYLVENGFVESRNRGAILLEKGLVLVNGKIQKSSYDVKETDHVEVVRPIKYLSMGGYKLEKAIKEFNLDLTDKICADIGCSKGGFTECMLNCGAKKVYAVDVSISELDEGLKNNQSVFPIEINARNLTEDTLKEKVDFVAVDCSFISIKYILKNLLSIATNDAIFVILLKPQFECGASNLTKKGIVKNKKILKSLCYDFVDYFNFNDLFVLNFTNAPIRENKNMEFLFCLSKQGRNLDKNNLEGILSALK